MPSFGFERRNVTGFFRGISCERWFILIKRHKFRQNFAELLPKSSLAKAHAVFLVWTAIRGWFLSRNRPWALIYFHRASLVSSSLYIVITEKLTCQSSCRLLGLNGESWLVSFREWNASADSFSSSVISFVMTLFIWDSKAHIRILCRHLGLNDES